MMYITDADDAELFFSVIFVLAVVIGIPVLACILVLLICCFCACCPMYRGCKKRELSRVLHCFLSEKHYNAYDKKPTRLGPTQGLSVTSDPAYSHSCTATIYEWRCINALQSGIIFFLIFKIWNIRNICFEGNFILSTSREFYYDDVIIVTWRRTVCAIFCPPVSQLPKC